MCNKIIPNLYTEIKEEKEGEWFPPVAKLKNEERRAAFEVGAALWMLGLSLLSVGS
jgi:hypothetical protein